MAERAGRGGRRRRLVRYIQTLVLGFAVILSSSLAPLPARAQSFAFSSVSIEGNQRIEDATILSIAGIERGQALSAGELNAAGQRIRESGLFAEVQLEPRGGTLVIRVVEFPTINRINFEGNRRLDDEELSALVQSAPRRVFNPAQAEADAAVITDAYLQEGRIAATVTPRIIPRSENRVDLVFEIFEGGTTEVERISFVGNRAFSDRRLRRVLETRQAGLLRALVRSDTFIADRIAFDRQLLTDFYRSRGYVDAVVQDVDVALTRERDAYLITFQVREGQQFRFGRITVTSDLPEVDPDAFFAASRLRSGTVYSPEAVDDTIARMERLAVQQGLDFVAVEPRVTRNDRALTLDVEFALVRGPRIFVERIDIEGNTTTLDRVIRRQFDVVEGDPFNPREIRQSAERIRALGFFSDVSVEAREGTTEEQVIVDVDVEETPTGTLSFGANFSTQQGVGLILSFSERNFLGRGQALSLQVVAREDSQIYSFSFVEPAFIGRDLAFGLEAAYRVTNNESDLDYDTDDAIFATSLEFPVSERGRLRLRGFVDWSRIDSVSTDASVLIQQDALQGGVFGAGIGYRYTFDSRRTGLNPDAGIILRFGQNFAVQDNDATYVETTILAGAETLVLGQDVTLRATFEGGAISFQNGNSRIVDRYFLRSSQFRGFAFAGVGPRDADTDDALGGNYYAVARFEAEFPLGLPEEYGITGGLFVDVGSVWGLDDTAGANVLYEDFTPRTVVGVSIFWTTPIGPLRFNFSEAVDRQDRDEVQNFDLTISTEF